MDNFVLAETMVDAVMHDLPKMKSGTDFQGATIVPLGFSI
jgi:hypothetical protein